MAAAKTPFDSAMGAALTLLRARSRSRAEILRALERRGHPAELAAQVADRLAELRYLDDAAFARSRAAALLRGRIAPDSIRQKLAGHGLEGAAVEAALAAAVEESAFDPQTAAREVLAKRRLDPAGLDPRGRARAARLLASRGFTEDTIEALLGGAMVDPPPEDG